MTVEQQDFQKILFKTAFCLMGCDGHIHEMEIKELKNMVETAPYFKGIVLSQEVDQTLKEFKEKGKRLITEVLDSLRQLDLSTVQELLVLEVAFRLAHADQRLDENEIKFIRFLRGKLELPDEVIKDRFGAVEYLFDRDYTNEIVRKETRKDVLSSLAVPDVDEIHSFDLD